MNAERIKMLRENLELTQNEMAKILNVSRSAYSLWEICQNTIPLFYLNKISNIFDINIDYLANISNVKKIPFLKTEIDYKNIGEKIKIARKSINYSQEKLSYKLNTVHSVISAYENGKTKIPTLFLIEISKLSGKSLNWFLNKDISN